MANTNQQTVLVIDDERGPRESLRILLKNTFNVLCADSVDWGLQLLKESQPPPRKKHSHKKGSSGKKKIIPKKAVKK